VTVDLRDADPAGLCQGVAGVVFADLHGGLCGLLSRRRGFVDIADSRSPEGLLCAE
jgi:hypothetical protein